MTRKELFDHYVADSLDEEATAELEELLTGDPEFAAQFAQDLLETGLFVQVGSELQRVEDSGGTAGGEGDSGAEAAPQPRLVTGDTGQGLPQSLQTPSPAPPPPPQSVPPPPPTAGLFPPGGTVAGPGDPGAVAEHQGPVVLKSAQKGSPVVLILIGVLLVAVAVAVVIGLTRKPPEGPQEVVVVAQVNAVEGRLVRTRGTSNENAKKGTNLEPGDTIKVEDGSARVGLVSGKTFFHMRNGCQVRFAEKKDGGELWLMYGELTAEVVSEAKGEELVVRTPQARVNVTGTKVTIRAGARDTLVEVEEGTVRVERISDEATVEVGKGAYAVVAEGGALNAWELVLGVNLNGEEVELGGNKWLSYANAQSNGLTLKGEGDTSVVAKKSQHEPKGFLPNPSIREVLMTSISAQARRLSLEQTLPNGRYQVFVWVMEDEDDRARSFRINVEEKPVEEEAGSKQLLGEWERLGPYDAVVEDGSLDLLLSPDQQRPSADPHLSGFAVYRIAGGSAPAPEPSGEEEPPVEEAPEEGGEEVSE